MANENILESYLVSLGFDINKTEYTKFDSTLKDAARLVETQTGAMVKSIFKWETAAVGAFVTVSGSILAMMDKVAMADQTYRLFGERMFMSTANARGLKIALDALGQPLEAIAFDPELYGRFGQLQRDQKALTGGLGGNAIEASLKQIRDIRFEFTRFEVELKYFAIGATQEIFKALGLGSGDLLTNLHKLNDYIIQHIPEWGKEFSTYVVPILNDTWSILKDIGMLLGDVGLLFTNVIGILSGNSALEGATFDFHKFAGALGTAAHWASVLLRVMIALTGTLAGAGIGATIGGFLGGPEGALVGAGIGAAGGATFDAWRFFRSRAEDSSMQGGVSDDDLAHAVALVESGNSQFNRDGSVKLGPANSTGELAVGAMQILPSTAKMLGINPYDEKQNREGGARYLRQLIQQNHGDVDAALAQYGGAKSKFTAAGQRYIQAVHARQAGYHPAAFGGGDSSTINVGGINIVTHPGMSPDHIADTVVARIEQARVKRVQRQMSELSPVYG